jgi:hypothetical protein
VARSLNEFTRFVQRFGYKNPVAFLLTLIESKHIATYKGRNLDRDLTSAAFQGLIPDLARRQRMAHQRSSARLRTLTDNFHTTAVLRLNQARSGQVRRELALRDLKEDFKKLYYESFQLGIRGSTSHLNPLEVMTPADRQWVDSAFIHEMRFFNRFVNQVLVGQLTPGQVDWRLRMYMNTVRGIYEGGRVIGTAPNTLIYWVYNPEAQHCESCLYLRDHSPYTKSTLPTTPRAGATECISNCKCHLRMIPADVQVVQQTERSHLSRNSMLRHLGSLKNRREPRWRGRNITPRPRRIHRGEPNDFD